MSASSNLRKEIDQHLGASRWELALSNLHQFWNSESGSAAAGYVIACYEKLRPFIRLVPYRVAILRSFTVEPAIPLLRASGLMGGIDLSVQLSGFDSYAQEMLDPDSGVYSFKPDAVILAVQTRDFFPELWDGYTDLTAGEHQAAVDKVGTLLEWLRLFRTRSTANLIVHNFEKPATPRAGLLDSQEASGQSARIEEINQRIRALTAEVPGMYVLDYEGLVSRNGRNQWHDERKWLTMRMPIAADKLSAMAQEWLRFLHPLCGRIGKVLVTDLDNTLWGGVIGEDGMGGIKLGREYPGAAHHALQRVLLDLHNRGILLVIASKNNEADAMQAIETHPEMLLRARHFAALQIHWESKADSLRRIAEKLNVGLDSLVFLDDNPVERQNVRVALPEVTVIDLPSDAMGYAQAVRECPLFERISASEEDRKRGAYYVEQRKREDLQRSIASVEDYYYSLKQQVEVCRVSKDTLGRAAQLLKKTNQFNLTTRRYSEADVARFADDPDWDVYLTRVADSFGDNGIVGVSITHLLGDISEIDNLLLSCRVIGRTVETAILHFLVENSRAKGTSQIQGWFLPTEKNKPAESFYSNHKFVEKTRTDSGTLWAMDIKESSVDCPPWIQLSAEQARVRNECAHA